MQCFTILPFLALLLLTVFAEDGHGLQHHHPSFPIQGRCSNPLLFVFGASMVDTGQYAAALPYSTAADFPPYGIDYFSRPAGRWSNGRVITDFISKPLDLQFQPLSQFISFSTLSFALRLAISATHKSSHFTIFKLRNPCALTKNVCIGLSPRTKNAL